MSFPVTLPGPAGARRFLRPALVAFASLALITCAEDPVGPASGEARLRLVPVFESNARVAPLAIDRARILVERVNPADETSETVVDDTVNFSVNKDRLKIDDIRIRMSEPTEDLQVTLELLAGSVLLFQGSQSLTVVRGRSTADTEILLTYQGPGGNVASLVLAPRDTVLSPGASFGFRLDAFDIQGASVPQYYASWSLTGGPATGAKINANGLLTAPAVRDTFYVKVVNIPTGTVDSTRVIIAPQAAPTVTPAPLAAGDDQSCRISGGVTYCWGANDVGQLGDGTRTDRLVPTPVAGGHTFVAVSIGVVHTCALTATGQAFCWGDNSTGALGDGTTTERDSPVVVSGGLAFAEIAAANYFTCAVTLTGQGHCWGANFQGQLGDGSTTSSSTPVAVTGSHSFTRISAAGFFDGSDDHACAIDNTGQAWCWGDNSSGQLGNDGTTNSDTPVAVSGGLSFSDISLGGESSCALATTGAIHCWGFIFGQSSTTPQPLAGGLTFTALDMGAGHGCGRATAGWVCAGDNFSGQLGDGTTTERLTPVAPSGGLNFTMLAAGDSHTCGLTATATYCWGYNGTGQLGTGDVTRADHLTPTLVVGAPASVTLSAGNGQSAPAGSILPISPAVLVRDGQGNPIPGVEVIFAVTAGGGSVNDGSQTQSVLTGAPGIATVSGWGLGTAPGTNGLSATVSALGVTGNPVGFTATSTTITTPTFTWTGGTSTDWSVAGNWSPAQVPGLLDSVVIGAAGSGRQPSLSATTVVGAVNIITGGNLTINGQGLGTTRGLTTGGTGVLTMTNAADVVSVAGNAVFGGGNELDLLSAGGLSIAGNLTQLASNSGDSFHPSGTHITVLAGVNPSISFATPGLVPGTSHFQELGWVGTGTLTLLTPAMAHGTLVVNAGTTSTISSTNGSPLTVGDLVSVGAMVLNNVPLTLSQATPGPLTLSNVTFQNMATNVSQLVVSHPGTGGTATFNNVAFSTTPVAPNGFYLDVTDNNGATDGVLKIDVSGSSPTSGGAFVRTAGGAVVNWPAGQTRAWTGATSPDWNTATNWNPAGVPGASDDVTIGATTFQPTLSADATARSIVISVSGARLTIGGHTLTITGNLTTHTDGLLVMTNPTDRVIVNGDAAFQGGDERLLLAAGELRLAGGFNQQDQTGPWSFVASGTHRTVMTGASLQVAHFCCTANTSGFQNLDISGSAGINIQNTGSGVFVFDTLISQVGAGPAPLLYTLGSTLTARRLRVDKLVVDRGTLILNEGGVAANEQFDNVTFRNYLTTQTQFSVVVPGGAASPRTLTFNNLTFQPLTTGDTGRYLTVSAPTGTLILNLPGATPVSNGPAFTTVSGAATVNWQ